MRNNIVCCLSVWAGFATDFLARFPIIAENRQQRKTNEIKNKQTNQVWPGQEVAIITKTTTTTTTKSNQTASQRSTERTTDDQWRYGKFCHECETIRLNRDWRKWNGKRDFMHGCVIQNKLSAAHWIQHAWAKVIAVAVAGTVWWIDRYVSIFDAHFSQASRRGVFYCLLLRALQLTSIACYIVCSRHP